MSRLSNGTTCIVNTTQEDEKVKKTLCDWEHDEGAKIPSFQLFWCSGGGARNSAVSQTIRERER